MTKIGWFEFIADEDHCECGVVGEGHHTLTPGQFMVALRTLNSFAGYSAEELMDVWRSTGRITHNWWGDDSSDEYAGLVCDETGESGVFHYCADGACAVHDDPERCKDTHFSDCRCDRAWCPGDGGALIATNLKPVTVVRVDWEQYGRLVDERLRATLQERFARRLA